MAFRELPSPELLRQLIDYDPLSGVMVWKPRAPAHFEGRAYDADRLAKSWNSRYAGRRADTTLQSRGYRTVTISDCRYLAHRIAYALMKGGEPAEHIDHLNGNRADNRWRNLRDATRQTNMRNSKTRPGSSGIVGVRQSPHGTWRATICGKYIGSYPTKEQAVAARKKRADQLGFTDRHGG